MTDDTLPDSSKKLAAIDLGSNSFHLLIVEYSNGHIKTLEKRGEKVQLADGMDKDGCLSDAAMARAMTCLELFAHFIDGIGADDIRIVGTNALRTASNSDDFLARAQALLDHDVEIISGREEARLIYLGAAHALAEGKGRRLVADIGGGSTEFIIGEHFTPLALESLDMGCVVYTDRFFADGAITDKNFRQAEREARSELANIKRAYQKLGWQDPIGTSGTIRAAAEVLEQHGQTEGGVVTREGLDWLKKRLIKQNDLHSLSLDGLKASRARVFPAGVAVLRAIFDVFKLERLRYANGALREGVINDLIGRDTDQDPRNNSLDALTTRFDVDTQQQHNVRESARQAFEHLAKSWSLTNAHWRYLDWAARVHELGLAISHAKFHRHGSYILEYADLAGFSRPEQQLLAFLVRAHRRKFPLRELNALPERRRLPFLRLAVILRLAVLLNHSRDDDPFTDFGLTAEGDTLELTLPDDALLRIIDAERECHYLSDTGLTLTVSTYPASDSPHTSSHLQ
ncbi:exopolyphosphatase [Larsenimonas suaedae]|uniref:Exopolyphosphatase n=1 Tax=Larsenimonas suaedae TaxID=1851019 RepID=A0ABU1GSA3_9GAMM|nr:exopolyphosphatase [Larsenimonas suaedae]MCM2972304.1 exopolyphosphatase [Larsenimonas suaedae]MDR5894900.1 exopolyphosphatase [Larsenimonas suaedae]